jgi:hypothetical protein
MNKSEFGNPPGTRFLWLCLCLILCGWGYVAYEHMPLAAPDCIVRSNPEPGNQSHYEDCAAFVSMITKIGWLIDFYHDDIAAAATVIIAIYTIILGRATIGLRDVAESQRYDTLRAIVASEAAAIAAKDAIELSRREFILAHRPRIRVKHVWLKRLAAGEPISIDLVVVNTGYALPSQVILRSKIFVSSASHLPERPPIPVLGYDLDAAKFINGWTFVLPVSDDPLTDLEYSSLQDGGMKLYCAGIFDYRHDLSGAGTTGGGTTAYCRMLELRRDEDGGPRFVVHRDPNYEYRD